VTIAMPAQNAEDSNPSVAQDQQESVPIGQSVSELQTNSEPLNPGVPFFQRPPYFNPLVIPPFVYLANLKNYFTQHQINLDSDKLKIAEFGIKMVFVNTAAYDTFSNFEAAFLAEDWIKITETIRKRRIFVEYYNSNKDKNESLLEFGRRKLKQVEDSLPDMPFAQFMAKFIAQVPRQVAAAIGQATPETSLQLEQILSKFDALPKKTPKQTREKQKRTKTKIFQKWALKNLDNIPPQLLHFGEPRGSDQGRCALQLQEPNNSLLTENSNVCAPTEGANEAENSNAVALKETCLEVKTEW
jgi:hypothetical protein